MNIGKYSFSRSQRQLALDFRINSKHTGCPGNEYLLAPRYKHMRPFVPVFIPDSRSEFEELE